MKRVCWGLGWLLAMLLWMPLAHAQNLVLQQAFWADPTGVADFAHAREQNYTPYEGILSRGYTASSTWIRIRINHQTGNPNDRYIVVRVQPNYLDTVELFDPLDLHEKPRVVGDLTSYADQEYNSPSYGFLLPVGHADRDVWLRVHSVNLHLIQIDAYGEDAMRTVDRNYWVTLSACLCLLLFLIVLNSFNWFGHRDWLHAVFLLRIAFFFFLLTIYFGFARVWLDHWLSPAWLDTAFNLGVLCSTVVVCYCEFSILSEFDLKPWPRWVRDATYAAMAVIFVLYGMGYTRIAIASNAIVLMGLFPGLLLTSIGGIHRAVAMSQQGEIGIQKKFFQIYYLIISLSHPTLQPWLLSLFGESPKILTLITFYALISSIGITWIVLFRSNNIRKHQNTIKANMALLHERITQERQSHEEKSALLAMLMHEVRNPLAVIEAAQDQRDAEGEELVRRNVGVIRSVLDRTMKMEKVNDETLQITKTRFLLSDCLAQALDDVGADSERVTFVNVPEEYICTDADCLLTILVNLLGNAIKYSSPQDRVTVEVFPEALPECLHMAVRNHTGVCGQPDAQLVFKKYYRSEAAKKLPGTGMGLYLVQQLAQRLGGSCQYSSTTEAVCFELFIPAQGTSKVQ